MWRRRSGTAVPWSNRLRIQLSATPSLSRRRRSRAVTTRSRPMFSPMLRSRMAARRMTRMICSVSKGVSGDACSGAQPIGAPRAFPPATGGIWAPNSGLATNFSGWKRCTPLIADALARAVGCGKPAPGCGWLWSVAGGDRGAARDKSSRGMGVMLVSLASYRSPPKARRKRCCCQSRIGQEAGAHSAQWLDDRQRMTKTLIGSSKSK